MFQRFLVPLDGTKRAEQAIPVAANLARVAHGTITLTRIIDPPPRGSEYYETDEIQLAQSVAFTEAKSYLDTLLDLYEQELEGLHLILDVTSGTIPSSLFGLANREHLDMIVMCSKGESGLRRWVMGSMTQATFRRSPLPVLVLNEHGENPTLFQETRSLRVLVPLDASELSETALTPVFQLLGTVPTSIPHQIHLLRVVSMPTIVNSLGGEIYATDTFWDAEIRQARRELQAVAQRLEQATPKTLHCVFSSSVVSSPQIATSILKQAQPTAYGGTGADYDLIALATHGRTGLKRLLLGSVTEQIFGATTLPLLIVHPSSAQCSEASEQVEEKKFQPIPEASQAPLFPTL